MKKTAVALVDCNNFYASCERVFKPQLKKKPIVVLSNNDGCVIARSNEAKDIGVPMGAPIFKHRDLLQKHKVEIFSSNFALYGDMSRRVMQCLKQHVERLEIYSIDEAFIFFEHETPKEAYDKCCFLQELIERWTGIPVSIGLSYSKTLAKLAAHFAKKKLKCAVYDMRNEKRIDQALQSVALEDVWGIGERSARRWYGHGKINPLYIKHSNPQDVRKTMGIVSERLVYELNGYPCLVSDKILAKKNIMSTRSFSKKTKTFDDLYRSLAHYTFKACEKLRKQNSYAQSMYVFIRTSKYQKNQAYYKEACTLLFQRPSQDTSYMLNILKVALRHIFKAGLLYNKAGIVLMDLLHYEDIKDDLFLPKVFEHKPKLMQVVDDINRKAGQTQIYFAAQDSKQFKQGKSQYRSPNYTTAWKELLKVH